MSKPLIQYEYRGHRITVTESKLDGFTLRIEGPHVSVATQAYSLDYIERAVARTIDSQMDRKLEAS